MLFLMSSATLFNARGLYEIEGVGDGADVGLDRVGTLSFFLRRDRRSPIPAALSSDSQP